MAGHVAAFLPAGVSRVQRAVIKMVHCGCCFFLHKDELIYLVVKIESCTCECSQCSATAK